MHWRRSLLPHTPGSCVQTVPSPYVVCSFFLAYFCVSLLPVLDSFFPSIFLLSSPLHSPDLLFPPSPRLLAFHASSIPPPQRHYSLSTDEMCGLGYPWCFFSLILDYFSTSLLFPPLFPPSTYSVQLDESREPDDDQTRVYWSYKCSSSRSLVQLFFFSSSQCLC